MNAVYIALGGNLSNPKVRFIQALNALVEMGVQVEAVSSLWRSPSWPPGQGHPDFLNAVAKVRTDLVPLELLSTLKALEKNAGRKPSKRNAPRPLDLDIIDYNGREITSKKLTLPHPRMQERAFVLFPFSEIDPDWVHPIGGSGIDSLIGALPTQDGLSTVPTERFWYPA